MKSPEQRYTEAREDVQNFLLSRTHVHGFEWMTRKQVEEGTGHGPNTVTKALSELGAAGLVVTHAGSFRHRGTAATPGITHPEETPIASEPAPKAVACSRRHQDPAEAVAHRAAYLRKEALAYALQGVEEDYTTEQVVERAKAFETYLTGTPTVEGYATTPKQAAIIRGALEDAEVTLAMIDAPDTIAAVRRAITAIAQVVTK